ncbi:glycosyltransferase family protein [Shouchella patagoniensis]|uniref:glycosyltransferase family protein n=1 Tax=Shouchella patagoniensis TaxID=228576 RepID=UPI000995536B|nr:glycosyltransferase family protein [Shouchella patagoniensis]
MDKQRVCFITCVNDEALYRRSVSHIDMLHLPRGFSVDKIGIRGAVSMTSGYNKAMKESDAKYKVYIHQDTMIINRMFLYDLLFLFEHHPKLGMLGVIGAKELPINGVWWDSFAKAGKILENRDTYGYLSFIEADYAYQPVEVIDGVLMATQYDLPWEEEFDGWHLYDTTQSLLFQKAGFEVGIAHQPHPWVLHECGVDFDQSAYANYIARFLIWKKNLPKKEG